MNKYINDNIIKLILNEIYQAKTNMKNHFIKRYQILTKNKTYIIFEDLQKLLNSILLNINTEMDKLYNYILSFQENNDVNINEIKAAKDYKIESNSELNIFTSKDIQEENKKITKNFQNETYSYMNINEKVENENAAKFLRNVAQISRISYNVSLKILKEFEEKYIKIKENKISLEDENIKKEFSFWIKTLEKKAQMNGKNKFELYQNILNQENPLKAHENSKQQGYLLNIYNDLSLMYFHCHISFPLVKIDFNTEEDFNSDKMIDFVGGGKNRKVNFVILPALISNGSFLQNGKYCVFTFSKNTFKFEDVMVKALNDLLNVENDNFKYIRENLKIKVICRNKDKGKYVEINTNIDIPEDMKYEFVFYYFNKNENKSFQSHIKVKQFEIEKNWEITKYEFILEDKILISSKDIINEN